jgi:hypothetical protein
MAYLAQALAASQRRADGKHLTGDGVVCGLGVAMKRGIDWFYVLIIVGVLAAIVWFTWLTASTLLRVPSGQPPVSVEVSQ